MYHVTADNAFPYRLCGGQQDSGSACVRQSRHGRRDHVPRLASGGHRRVRHGRARSEESRSGLRRARTTCRCTTADRADDARSVRAGGRGAAAAASEPPARTVRTQPLIWSPKDPQCALLRDERRVEDHQRRPQLDAHQRRSRRAQTWEVPANAGKYASHRDTGADGHRSPRSRRRRSTSTCSGPAPAMA